MCHFVDRSLAHRLSEIRKAMTTRKRGFGRVDGCKEETVSEVRYRQSKFPLKSHSEDSTQRSSGSNDPFRPTCVPLVINSKVFKRSNYKIFIIIITILIKPLYFVCTLTIYIEIIKFTFTIYEESKSF